LKQIKFREASHFGRKKLGEWQFAKNEKEFYKKIKPNRLYEVHMPCKNWFIRLWRKFFPLAFVEMKVGVTLIMCIMERWSLKPRILLGRRRLRLDIFQEFLIIEP
jgi:hypothetical protein